MRMSPHRTRFLWPEIVIFNIEEEEQQKEEVSK